MSSITLARTALAVAGVYDGVLGVAFLVAGPALFEAFDVRPPNHWGYIQFPAALLVVFALMFFAAAARPRENRNLIPYGILLKVSYCATVFYHWAARGLPDVWKPFAWMDLGWIFALAWAWRALESAPPKGGAS